VREVGQLPGTTRWGMITFLSWGPALVWAVAIFVFSHQSQPPMGGLAADYILHFLAYLVFGLTLTWGITERFREEFTIKRTVIVLVFACLYAASDELHQSFIPGRDASLQDFFADTLGASASVWTLCLFSIRQQGGRSG